MVIFYLSLLLPGGLDPRNHGRSYSVHGVNLLSWLLPGCQGLGAWEKRPGGTPSLIFALLAKDSRSYCSWLLGQKQPTCGCKNPGEVGVSGKLPVCLGTSHQGHTLHYDLAAWGTGCYTPCSLSSLCYPLRGSVADWSQERTLKPAAQLGVPLYNLLILTEPHFSLFTKWEYS